MTPVQHITPASRPATRGRYDDLAPLFDILADRSISTQRRRDAREALVRGHLPVAAHIALRFRGRGQPAEDLRQVATVGLIHAVDRFDPGRGADFLTFAVPTITGEVRRHFRDIGWAVRMPRRLQELCQAVRRVVNDLSGELARAPKPSEIARRLDIPIAEACQGLEVANAYHACSLDVSGSADAPAMPVDLLGKDDLGMANVEDRATLYPALACLPERERAIVLMRFFGDMTQTQIAQRLHISQMHVSRLLAESFAQLREIITEEGAPQAA